MVVLLEARAFSRVAARCRSTESDRAACAAPLTQADGGDRLVVLVPAVRARAQLCEVLQRRPIPGRNREIHVACGAVELPNRRVEPEPVFLSVTAGVGVEIAETIGAVVSSGERPPPPARRMRRCASSMLNDCRSPVFVATVGSCRSSVAARLADELRVDAGHHLALLAPVPRAALPDEPV